MKTIPLLLALAVGPQLSGAALEREARTLESMLIAPCCFAQQVSVHQSPAADEVRKDVRVRLAAGQTRQQILDAYVAEYGVRVLAQPPAAGFNLALYVLPPLLLLGSAGVVIFLVRRFARRPSGAIPAATVAATTQTGAYDERLDDELRDLD